MKNKYLVILALIQLLVTSSAFSQIRHGPPIDTKDPVDQEEEPIVSVTPDKERSEVDTKDAKKFEKKFQKLYVDLKSNWKKCISPEAPLPTSLLDAHAQMQFFLTPAPVECDPAGKKKVLCLMNKSQIKRDLRQLKKLPVISEVVLHDKSKKPQMSAKELVESLEKMTKK